MSLHSEPPPQDDGGRVSIAAIAGGVLVLAVVAGLAWLATGSGPSRPGPSALQQAVRLPDVWAVAPAAEAAVAALPPAVMLPAADTAAVPPGKLEVCGEGLVDEAAWSSPARVEARAASVDATRRRVAALLRADPDEAVRAAGLALEALERHGPAAAADSGEPAADAARDQLARLALTTRSSDVYALALRQCRSAARPDDAPACRMVSAEQWARLDPGNAVPWLAVADAAKARGDAAAVGEALYRVSQARTVADPLGRVSRVVIDHLPAGVPDIEAIGVAMDAFGLEAVGMTTGYAVVAADCRADGLADPNRRQRCDAIADTLWRHGTNLLDWTVAAAVARQVGWPAERLQALRDERDALLNVGQALVGDHALGCAAIGRQLRHLQAVGRNGEVAALRERLESSGRTVADWARKPAAAVAAAASAPASQPAPLAAALARADDAASAPGPLR